MSDGTHETCGVPHILVTRSQKMVDGKQVWVRDGRLDVENCPEWCDGELAAGAEFAVPEDGPFPYQGVAREVRADWCSNFVVGTTPRWPERCGSKGDRLRRRWCNYVGADGEIEVRELSDSLLDATLVLRVSPAWGEGRAVVCDTNGGLECIGYDVEPESVTLVVQAYVPLVDVDGEGWVPRGSAGTEGL